MASSFVVKHLFASNLLTRSIVMFPRTATIASRSFNTIADSNNTKSHPDGTNGEEDVHYSGSLNLSFDGYMTDPPECKLCLSVGLNGELQKGNDTMKSVRGFNLLHAMKKMKYSYKHSDFAVEMKDGVCKLTFPNSGEVEIKLK